MKVHPQSRLALSMPTRRHIAFSPFEAQRAPHEGSVPYVNGKRFHADVCGEIAENRARKKAAVYVEHTPYVGDYRYCASCVVPPKFISQYTTFALLSGARGERKLKECESETRPRSELNEHDTD